MSLFEVPGWSVPSAPVPQQNKKRKRPSTKDTVDDIDEAQRIKAAQKNIEKLMASLGAGSGDLEEGGSEKPKKKKREVKEKAARVSEPERGRKIGHTEKGVDPQSSTSKRKKKGRELKAEPSVERSQERAGPSQKKQKQRQKQNRKPEHTDPVDSPSDPESPHETTVQLASPTTKKTEKVASKKGVGKEKDVEKPQGLTALQANMKKSLDGARFRWINEMLYKSDSAKAHELMSSDPAVFADYHTGFRHQVESWPTNPVSHYISTLSSYPARTVIADLGCGDAALARALIPRGLTVLSFDLRPDGAYVIEADTCARVPLPGSEKPLSAATSNSGDESEAEGEGQVVDVVICALSLMGTNWPGCIREAWRILKTGGELKIAEVTSRFADVTEFTSFISSFGFKLVSKDERNTHFTLFEFKKTTRKFKSEKEWKKTMSRGDILKACEYKRR